MSKELGEGDPRNLFDTRKRLITIEQALESLSTIPCQELLQSTLREEWSNLIQLMEQGGYLMPRTGIRFGDVQPPLAHFPRKFISFPAGFNESIRYIPNKKAFYVHYVDSHGRRQILDRHISAITEYIGYRYKEKEVREPALRPQNATAILFQSLAKPSTI